MHRSPFFIHFRVLLVHVPYRDGPPLNRFPLSFAISNQTLRFTKLSESNALRQEGAGWTVLMGGFTSRIELHHSFWHCSTWSNKSVEISSASG